MHPLVCLLIPSTTGRNDMQMRIVLAITPMRLDHDDIAALEGLAAHCTKEIVQALHPTLHERTEQRFSMLIKWCSQDIRHGEDNMPIDDPVMEHLTNLRDPIVDIDLGTSQTQRRLTAHGNAMFPLTTIETAVLDIAYLVRIPTPEHFVDKVIVVGRIVARTERFKPLPMLGKDLFKNVPTGNGFCIHRSAPIRGVLWCYRGTLYHVQAAKATPSSGPLPNLVSFCLSPQPSARTEAKNANSCTIKVKKAWEASTINLRLGRDTATVKRLGSNKKSLSLWA